MGVDHNVVLDMERVPVSPSEVTMVREQSTHTNRWRLCGTLLAMALCVSAALFFTLHAKRQDQTEEAEGEFTSFIFVGRNTVGVLTLQHHVYSTPLTATVPL